MTISKNPEPDITTSVRFQQCIFRRHPLALCSKGVIGPSDVVVDGNDGPHRHGSGCDSIRIYTTAGGRVRTERRPERRILRLRKHKINETRVIDPVFLGSMVKNGGLALDVAEHTSL